MAVRNRRIAFIDDQSDLERSFHRRLVEGREGPTRISCLKLGCGIAARAGTSKVKTAEFVVEDSRELNVDRRRTCCERLCDRERGLFIFRSQADLGFLGLLALCYFRFA